MHGAEYNGLSISNLSTIVCSQSGLINGVSPFQGWICTIKHILKCPYYRGVLISGGWIRGNSPNYINY